MRKIYIVDSTEDERSELRDLIKKGKPSARKVARMSESRAPVTLPQTFCA